MRQMNKASSGLTGRILLSLSLVGSSFVPTTAFAQSEWLSKIQSMRSKSPSARLEWLEKGLGSAPESERPLLLMEKGLALESQGKFVEAAGAYQDVIKTSSSMVEYAYLFSARLALQEKQLEKAKLNFEKLLELSPNLQLQNEAKFELAKIELHEGKPLEARKVLLGLEKRNRSEAVYPDMLWELARAERASNNQPAFCKWMKKLFVAYPGDRRVVGWTSDLSAAKVDDKPTGCALTLEERRRRIKNLQWGGLSERAWVEIEQLRNVKGEDPFDVVMLEALYHLHEGEVSEAMKLLLPHYETKKNNFTFLTTLATAAARSGETQLAVGSYYTASKLSPKSALGRQALYQAAFLSYQFQDYDGASRRFQEVMKTYPNSGLARDARWHLAWIRYLRGDYEGAYKAFTELRGLNSKGRRKNLITGEDRLQYWTAMSLFRQAKYAEAKSQFENIARVGGQSYYALASIQRLRKIENLIPKPVRPVLTEQSTRLSRFSNTELMVPADDFDGRRWVASALPEESESEETMVLSPLSSGAELSGTTADESAPAEEETANAESTRLDIAEESSGDGDTRSSFSNPTLVKRFERARDLMILGLNDWAKWDLYDIERRTSNKEYLKNLMSEYETIGQYHRSASIAQNAFAGQRSQYGIDGVRYLWQHAYPQAYKNEVSKSSTEFGVASHLVWGIMKAESAYKRDVVSPVGAIGLMQIMPNTGNKLAGLLRDKSFTPQNLYQPEVSIRLGTKYLQRLMKQFDQNFALTAAGYNAGPHRVRGWLASFGQLDLDEFVEHIPFLETRNYVKRVLSNSYVYTQLYGGSKEFYSLLTEPLKIRFQSASANKETWEDI
ncbi:MAG: transglycosylase SLT domain-containing protein [Bdellovibrionaceae bacterium]|nr:transglycosylase SLT domain-containing protein [Pseudobdellovibrionaceae bacterium]